ncbi:hypothetical protein EDB81DRAFT_779632 [Dactylonectria macrodidyma]|uniref:Uncharacterized protein n=1 Tax=Dactylonectria macrodidyma TaxID=307937 RepID=A0A9P9FJZ6_9HYPO|nr:hypothetical protein EDB81DRAFT_779632 [Dactylonectria macrodidyma]
MPPVYWLLPHRGVVGTWSFPLLTATATCTGDFLRFMDCSGSMISAQFRMRVCHVTHFFFCPAMVQAPSSDWLSSVHMS